MADSDTTPDPESLLNPRQKKFVDEYLIDFNASAAFIRAGYKAKDGSVARANAARLIADDNVRTVVNKRKKELAEIAGLNLVEIIEELKIIGQSDISHYRSNGPSVVLAEGAPPNAMRAVSSIEITTVERESSTEYRTKIRLWDKNTALIQAGKYLGIFPERMRHGGDPDNKTPIPISTSSGYPIDELDLPIETRKMIRDRIIKKEADKKKGKVE